MFEDCGKKIQSVSIVFFVLGLIGALVLAIVLGDKLDSFWAGAGAFLGFGVLSFVGTLIINGFGKIVENNEGQLKALERSAKREENKKEEEREEQIIRDCGWKCVCGRVNSSYISTCYCGKKRNEGEVKTK